MRKKMSLEYGYFFYQSDRAIRIRLDGKYIGSVWCAAGYPGWFADDYRNKVLDPLFPTLREAIRHVVLLMGDCYISECGGIYQNVGGGI